MSVSGYHFLPPDEKTVQNAKASAVSLIWYPNEKQEPILIMIERPTYDGVHSGQMAFPGGRREEEDKDLFQTAIRETAEEIGLKLCSKDYINQLTPFYVRVSNFLITPYVFNLNQRPSLIPQESEVFAIHHFSLSDLQNESHLIYKDINVRSIQLKKVRGFQIGEQFIWGASACILNELLENLS